jgi:hypothetical protein
LVALARPDGIGSWPPSSWLAAYFPMPSFW